MLEGKASRCVSQRRPLRHEQVVYDGARIICHDKRARRSDMRYIDYGLGVFTADAFASESAARPFDFERSLLGTGRTRYVCWV